MSPLGLLAKLRAFALLSALALMGGNVMAESASPVPTLKVSSETMAAARQDIEYLRRWYAKATDLLGENTPESIAEGTRIYHRIFTPDAHIRTSGATTQPYEAVGPDAWAEVANTALESYVATQHLIGTQVVDIKSLVLNDACEVVSGSARMESYVQAWHELTDENKVWIYLGTYFDEVEFEPGQGWRIVDMKMEQMAGETRFMDEAVGGAK